MNKVNVSVCMATYNGEKYLSEQLNSILPQLNNLDELVIVDDNSTDNTIKIIEKYNDQRIKLFKNKKNIGPNKTFEKAIMLSTGDLIFLSDQDDIWINNRVDIMKNILISNESLLLSSNTGFIDIVKKNYIGVLDKNSNRYYKNIIDIFIGIDNYYGCGMAFKKDLKKYILPIPNFVESHDLWIAKAANLLNLNLHLEKITLYRRIHENNFSGKKRSFYKKIYSRIIFLKSIITLKKRIYAIK